MSAKITALFGVAVLALSSSAFAGHNDRVTHVYSGRTVVPVVVKQDHSADRPYALTGRNTQVEKTQKEEIRVGSRVVGYHVR